MNSAKQTDFESPSVASDCCAPVPSHVSLLEHMLVFYARTFPLRRGKLPVVNALWRRAMGKRGPHRVALLKHGGFKMPCDISQMLQRQFYFFGTYFVEEDNLIFWAALAREAEIVLDVGANAGIYSLAAIAASTDARVHAFEPTPEIAERLRKAARWNHLENLHVHQSAVSSGTGIAHLVPCRGCNGNNDGMNYLSSDHAAVDSPIVVDTITIDKFCIDGKIGHIDLLKMDVQGHEYDVLLGAQGMLSSKCIKTIFLELNWSHGEDCAATKAINMLERFGYSFLEPVLPAKPRKAGPWLHRLENVVAIAAQAPIGI